MGSRGRWAALGLAAALLAASWGAAQTVGAAAPDGPGRAGPTVARFPGTFAGERYGSAVAIDFAVPDRDYSFAAVSAPWGSSPGEPERSGRVDIYTDYLAAESRAWHWTGGSVVSPSPKADGEFGFSVDLTDDGDVLVVGEPYSDLCGVNKGAVHLFTRSGGVYSPAASVCWTALTAGDRFGHAVAISADADAPVVAVGAPNADSGNGAVFAFTFDDGLSLLAGTRLQPTSVLDGGCLGSSVSVDRTETSDIPLVYEDHVLAGAPCWAPDGDPRGASIWFFQRSGGSDPVPWEQDLIGFMAPGDFRYGTAVVLTGPETAGFVGAPGTNAVYDTSTLPSSVVLPPTHEASDEFGAALDAPFSNLLVGAPGADEGGHAFWFIPGGDGWRPAQWFRSSERIDERYGSAVAIGPDTAVIGAPGSEGLQSPGAVEFVELEIGADLWIEVDTLPDVAAVGDEVAVTVTIGNDGPSDAEEVAVWMWLSPRLSHVAHDGPGYYDPEFANYWTIGPLEAGTMKTLHITMQADEPGIAEVLAEVLSADPGDIDSIPMNQEDGEDDFELEVFELHTALCAGEVPTILGTDDDDDLEGTAERDVIHGLGGDDVISGLAGDDLICGGDGNDLLKGGPGDDTLVGGDGNDKVRGAAGDDHLFGGAGSDRLLPEFGNDEVSGGEGSDIVDYLAGTGPVSVDLAAGISIYSPVGAESWTHTLALVEKVDGTRYDDMLMGDWKRNVLRGKQGSDEIWGLDGDDDLIGGTGNDTILGGQGDDLVKGQANDDVLRGEGGADKVVGGAGNDTLRGGTGDDLLIGGLRSHLGVFFNSLDGGAGTDTCRWEAVAIGCEP